MPGNSWKEVKQKLREEKRAAAPQPEQVKEEKEVKKSKKDVEE